MALTVRKLGTILIFLICLIFLEIEKKVTCLEFHVSLQGLGVAAGSIGIPVSTQIFSTVPHNLKIFDPAATKQADRDDSEYHLNHFHMERGDL